LVEFALQSDPDPARGVGERQEAGRKPCLPLGELWPDEQPEAISRSIETEIRRIADGLETRGGYDISKIGSPHVQEGAQNQAALDLDALQSREPAAG
jgi:hypothetical protein